VFSLICGHVPKMWIVGDVHKKTMHGLIEWALWTMWTMGF
jgi:hypothetical protein